MSYHCFDCAAQFEGQVCPGCGVGRGQGHVSCQCGVRLLIDVPHWDRSCNLYNVVCPRCGTRNVSLCIC